MGMTLQSLTQAIQQHIDTEMDAEVAAGMAEHALGFFGFYNRIIDNALEPTDRNLFYMFQDYDLLTTESRRPRSDLACRGEGGGTRTHFHQIKSLTLRPLQLRPLERLPGLEPGTFALARQRSTN